MSGSKSTEKSAALVKSAFREYYFSKLLEIPEHLEQREFGYMPFGSGMIRHLSFRNRGDILGTLIQDVPADVYCSNAYYRFPTYPMQEKRWFGADLIFDIGAKDLHLPCELGHSYFICLILFYWSRHQTLLNITIDTILIRNIQTKDYLKTLNIPDKRMQI